MPLQWVQAKVYGRITDDSRIICETGEMKGMNTPRPRENFADSGADLEVFDRLRHRVPGEFKTLAFMGGATSILVPTESLLWFDDPRLMDRLAQKYGPMTEWTFVAMVRNTGAPTIWNVAEPAGGMAEDFNLQAEQIGETTELGVYKEDGWLMFVLPDSFSQVWQDELRHEQARCWNILNPSMTLQFRAPITFLNYGEDELNGQRGYLVAGPVGDFQILSIAKLDLPGIGWRLRDLELRPGKVDQGEPDWVALDRKVVGIMKREGQSPMMYEFAKEGGLDHCGLHLALSGEVLQYNISHLTIPTLKMLGWLKEKGR